MTALSLSDLSQMFQLRRDTVRVRQDLATAARELGSGKKANLGAALSGNYAPLVALDRQVSALAGYQTNAKEAAVFADAAQAALERARTAPGDLGIRLASVGAAELATAGPVLATQAQGAFEVSVSALNGSIGGRSVFGGAATDRAPLASASVMLGELRGLVAAEDTAAGVVAAVDAWFAPGGGFDTMGYVGSEDSLSAFQLGEGRQVELPISADDDALRGHLRGLAIAAMLESSAITAPGEKAQLAELASEAIITNQNRLVSLQAQVGLAQARIETASVENASETSALNLARNDIVLADPYEVATRLQNLEVQLQTVYTLTARLSGLSLTNYLR